MRHNDLAHALEIFGLSELPDRDSLERTRQELLAIWHPHRYASLTNNPRKYMQMYKKGEVMTKEIQAAYEILVTYLAQQPTGE